MAFFGLQTFKLKDFSKIYQFKVLKPKKGHSNFYKCCDLKKVYLSYTMALHNTHKDEKYCYKCIRLLQQKSKMSIFYLYFSEVTW